MKVKLPIAVRVDVQGIFSDTHLVRVALSLVSEETGAVVKSFPAVNIAPGGTINLPGLLADFSVDLVPGLFRG